MGTGGKECNCDQVMALKEEVAELKGKLSDKDARYVELWRLNKIMEREAEEFKAHIERLKNLHREGLGPHPFHTRGS